MTFKLYTAMGLGSFRMRLATTLLIIFVVWQSVRYLAPSWENGYSEKAQVKDDDGLQKHEVGQLQKVVVGVYYEALCPDSRNFFLKQLEPAFDTLNGHVTTQMVPYGKAKTIKKGDSYEFECQHGPVECRANIIHACAIDVIVDQSLQLKFLVCMITNNFEPEDIAKTCAERLQVEIEPILNCYKGSKGKELLANYGKMTDALGSAAGFIPTITLDGSPDNQRGILKNLLKEVCLHFKEPVKGCPA